MSRAATTAAIEGLERARLLGERFVLRLPSTSPSVVLSGPSAPPPTPLERAFDRGAWETLREEVQVCTRCELHATRTQAVWGSGTPHTTLVVIGEAPGFHEDQQGEAFVGRAGQLLSKILEAIGFGRDAVFITNILKSRPPGNADPLPHQVAACLPYLERQIELIGPAAILALGRHATRALTAEDASMAALRGRVFQWRGVPLVATYHPAALLRNPQLKRPTWEDVQLLRRVHDEALTARGAGGA